MEPCCQVWRQCCNSVAGETQGVSDPLTRYLYLIQSILQVNNILKHLQSFPLGPSRAAER